MGQELGIPTSKYGVVASKTYRRRIGLNGAPCHVLAKLCEDAEEELDELEELLDETTRRSRAWRT